MPWTSSTAGIDEKTFTIEDKLRELRRELTLRRKVYPNFVLRGQVSVNDARWQIGIMEAIIHDYEKLARIEPGDSLFEGPGQN